MKKLIFSIAAMVVMATVAVFTVSTSNAVNPDLLMANVEALAGGGEDIEGKICYYPGGSGSDYSDYIPCTAEYPNIGKCGERKNQFYTDSSAQCYN